MNNKCVEEILSKEKFIKNYVEERGTEICAYERIPATPGTSERYFLLEVKITQNRRSYMFFQSEQKICNSKLFVTNMKKTVREIKMEIFKYFRPLIPQKGGQTGAFKHVDKEDEEQRIEADYKYYFGTSSKLPEGNQLYQLLINNTLPTESSMLYSNTQATCDFCGKSHKNANCLFDLDDNLTMK